MHMLMFSRRDMMLILFFAPMMLFAYAERLRRLQMAPRLRLRWRQRAVMLPYHAPLRCLSHMRDTSVLVYADDHRWRMRCCRVARARECVAVDAMIRRRQARLRLLPTPSAYIVALIFTVLRLPMLRYAPDTRLSAFLRCAT